MYTKQVGMLWLLLHIHRGNSQPDLLCTFDSSWMHGPVSQVQAHDSQTLVHHSAWACPIHIGIMIADVFLVCCQSYLFIVATITIIPMIGMMLPVSFPFIIMIPCKQVGCDCDRIMDVSWFTCHSLKVEDNGHEQGLP